MSQQVLARKWRPRSFQEVVGQTAVVRALTNALTQNRLHHAYLFTGTRGVGKTSLARLLAKCLNCETGVTATPCEQCSICQAIDQGRFFDLFEIDAASRTKVEDTRELLENVQYAPVQGRFKIYLIDEVHMLSNHSFNALLKTLEEPPAHVKFLLATTDPQRLPITVLSRCLQFHLKNLTAEQIALQLDKILMHEAISYEAAALTSLAQAADGSMRDALSLLDQAIAFSDQKLTLDSVQTLLGKTEPEILINLIEILAEYKTDQLLPLLQTMAENGVDFATVLEDLLSLLHQISMHQVISDYPLSEKAAALAKQLHPEELQLFYQIALIGRRDLPLAPNPRSGFEMLILRMLAFKLRSSDMKAQVISKPQTQTRPATAPAPQAATKPSPTINQKPESDWEKILANLDLHGAAHALAHHCALESKTDDSITLILEPQHAPILSNAIEQRISQALNNYFQKTVRLQIKIIQDTSLTTPAVLNEKRKQDKLSEALTALEEDPHIQALKKQFNAKIVPGSVKVS